MNEYWWARWLDRYEGPGLARAMLVLAALVLFLALAAAPVPGWAAFLGAMIVGAGWIGLIARTWDS